MNREAIVNVVVAELKRLRMEKGISQRALAERAALSQSGIAHMECGRTTPTLLFLLTVAEAIEIDIGEVIVKALVTENRRRP